MPGVQGCIGVRTSVHRPGLTVTMRLTHHVTLESVINPLGVERMAQSRTASLARVSHWNCAHA
jgi:hypothetical protein